MKKNGRRSGQCLSAGRLQIGQHLKFPFQVCLLGWLATKARSFVAPAGSENLSPHFPPLGAQVANLRAELASHSNCKPVAILSAPIICERRQQQRRQTNHLIRRQPALATILLRRLSGSYFFAYLPVQPASLPLKCVP